MSHLIEGYLNGSLALLLLALVRSSGIFLAAPFYSGPNIPARVKVAVAFAIALCALPAAGAPAAGERAIEALSTPLGLAVAAAGELALGFAMGLAGACAVAAIQTAGYLMAQDIGLTIANVIDPITNAQVSVIGELKAALAIALFLGLDFHHGLVRLVAASFRLVPPGAAASRALELAREGRPVELCLRLGRLILEGAVRLGFPVTVTLLLVTVAMGFLARAVPEMNVFIIGFALRVLVGLWVIILTLPLTARALTALFERAAREAALALSWAAGS